MKKIITLLFIASLILMNNKKTHAQVGIEEINFQLRDLFQHLKRPADSLPFLFEMSSHVMDEKLYRSYNDSDYISKGMFLTMYQEMRAAAYDTNILEHADVVDDMMRKRSRNDTVNIAILNADYATFMDDAFTVDGQFYNITDSTITDVPNRAYDPFLNRNVFVSTLTSPVSYFRKVIYKIDPNFLFTKEELRTNVINDLDPDFARWKIDFGDGSGWRAFDPRKTTEFVILYPDTGVYDLKIAVFYCDPYPNCNSLPDKLSKTSIYILNNATPKDPDLTYEFGNVITVGLYKGCGEMKGGVYIPQKPFIIVEGIDLLNTRSIPVLYEENVNINYSKKLGLLSEYNYDFYIVNFNDTHLDLRENAKGIVQLIDYLKSIMTTNEQFVVFAESMGGIIARYTLTFMENDAYTQDPLSNKPAQMHNTRLYISNDAPHQGATVPIAFQSFYRNIHNAFYYKVLKNVAYNFPLLSEEKYWRDVLDSKSVQQLLAYHVDANGPHQNRIDFMNDLIGLNPQTNGYPAYTKMMAFTDGLLSGQSQLTLDNNIMKPGMDILKLQLKVQLVLYKWIKINLIEENLTLKSVDKNNPTAPLVISNTKLLYRKSRGCLKQLLRGNIVNYVTCVFNPREEITSIPQVNITSNYDSDPAGIFSILSMLSSYNGFENHFKFPFNAESFVDSKTGYVKINLRTSPFLPLGYIKSKNLDIKLKLTNFGIAFIPVQSAIDFDYYKTLNISANYNLLQHNVQDFLLAYSPFHVISGFNYRGNDYPLNADASKNSRNWSHGFINNLEIDGSKDQYILNREIGDHTLYLNNLNLYKRNADFNCMNLFNGIQNPYYSYIKDGVDEYPNSKWNIYSKSSSFAFTEPSIVNLYYQDKYQVGNYLLEEGLLNIKQRKIIPCSTKHLRQSILKLNSEIIIYPNPFVDIISIRHLKSNNSYKAIISDVIGKIIYEFNFNTSNEGTVDLNNLNNLIDGIYILKIYSNNESLSNYKIIKVNRNE